jgi:hypothetical protein
LPTAGGDPIFEVAAVKPIHACATILLDH